MTYFKKALRTVASAFGFMLAVCGYEVVIVTSKMSFNVRFILMVLPSLGVMVWATFYFLRDAWRRDRREANGN